MIDPLDPRLAELHEPAPPSALAATVMARIARDAAFDSATAARSGPAPAPSRGGSLGGLRVLAGLVLVVGVVVDGWIRVGFPDLFSPRIGNRGLVMMPVDGWTSLLLCAGLVLYLLGLFAPLRGRASTGSSAT